MTRIDMLLQGGLFQGNLVELVGPSSSGKTQVRVYVIYGTELV